MNFEGMSPQQVAAQLAKSYAFNGAIQVCERETLAAIQHFSSRNLVAARRHEYILAFLVAANVEWVNGVIERAERLFPDA